ncbi:MAG: cadmium-translocating P-type ATPase [Chloroflexi bacterium]|nr:cadmium-translocating P-type ATPase [Chloroflexota bacterium]
MTTAQPGRIRPLIHDFRLPLIVLLGIMLYVTLEWQGWSVPALVVVLVAIGVGSFHLAVDIYASIRRGQYALDFIALLAIVVALITSEFLVGAIISLMLSTGRTLEAYGVSRARESLTRLVERLPDEVVPIENGQPGRQVKVGEVRVGDQLLVRKGEVIALDGTLLSPAGLTDESSLTGEPYELEKTEGDLLRSGTINIGEPIVMEVVRASENSTYSKIIKMVQAAQQEKPPLIRLADRYATLFTMLTLAIAGLAFALSRSLDTVLAVLVIATPCPLILAAPIALLGGVNSAARQRIIVKSLASLEVLARVDAIVFDKTGTLTLGRPTVARLEVTDPTYSEEQVLAVAEALERNSLHPIAKAIVSAARLRGVPVLHASEVRETIGRGIDGEVEGQRYEVSKLSGDSGMASELRLVNGRRIAVISFEEEIKPDSQKVMQQLKRFGFKLHIFTGDRLAAARRVADRLGQNVAIRAECTPEDKLAGLEQLKRERHTTAMVGDGINDAPALAQADVGMVFSHEEQTASSEAADIVFLDGDLSVVKQAILIARRTIAIAKQSIVWGIGLSVVGMLFAAFGLIPPLVGAFLQEAIDVAVIVNALRASHA